MSITIYLFSFLVTKYLVNSLPHMQNILTTCLTKVTQKSTSVIELGNPALFFMNPEDNGETGIR